MDWWSTYFIILKLIWKPLFASTVNYELAEAEGMNPDKVQRVIYSFISSYNRNFNKNCWITIDYRNVIMPAAMARNVSNNPKQMVIFQS